jgi:putative two-component system response regulator
METRELRFRRQIVVAGVLTTWVTAAFALVYVLASWHTGGHRPLVLAIVLAASVDALAISSFPRERLTADPVYNRFLAGWNSAHIIVGTALCVLDGGPSSPFVAIFFISVAFAACSLPLRTIIGIAALDVVAVTAVAVIHERWEPATLVWGGTLCVIAGVCATIAQDRAGRIAELQDAREEIPRRLARVVEYRDNDTGGHIERMAEYSGLIARALGLPAEDRRELRLASTMHDIGKVAVPDAILQKPGRLTPEERTIMETHAQVGHDMLAGSGSALIELAATIALTHHERWDGAGYPQRLAGEAIPVVGRIVAVADVFDAITSKRVYKDATDVDTAVGIIREGRGTQFDPAVVDAFDAALPAILDARGHHADASALALVA